MACRGRYAPLVPRGHRRLGGASPLFAAHRGFQVLQEPAHAAPDPKGPFLPESDHLLFVSWPSRVERSGANESNAHLEVYGLGCCPYTMPRQIFRGAEHESLRSQYAGEPAMGCVGLLFVAMRVMVVETKDLHVFQHRDLGCAVARAEVQPIDHV